LLITQGVRTISSRTKKSEDWLLLYIFNIYLIV
jgi:hypothetical protein